LDFEKYMGIPGVMYLQKITIRYAGPHERTVTRDFSFPFSIHPPTSRCPDTHAQKGVLLVELTPQCIHHRFLWLGVFFKHESQATELGRLSNIQLISE
jgi:hypothetical protein